MPAGWAWLARWVSLRRRHGSSFHGATGFAGPEGHALEGPGALFVLARRQRPLLRPAPVTSYASGAYNLAAPPCGRDNRGGTTGAHSTMARGMFYFNRARSGRSLTDDVIRDVVPDAKAKSVRTYVFRPKGDGMIAGVIRSEDARAPRSAAAKGTVQVDRDRVDAAFKAASKRTGIFTTSYAKK